ncbi:uncharacterized protein LOC123293904 [Chrysoperla carnea]|uniref:uncharacterized protein LOC123293904 n=1 Tax=Chrysoperla carnea TaxID=189513 RepID=UPI001D07A446|nr:uncharacterized protein LOC123293904 [Chrysoperla carnea]
MVSKKLLMLIPIGHAAVEVVLHAVLGSKKYPRIIFYALELIAIILLHGDFLICNKVPLLRRRSRRKRRMVCAAQQTRSIIVVPRRTEPCGSKKCPAKLEPAMSVSSIDLPASGSEMKSCKSRKLCEADN